MPDTVTESKTAVFSKLWEPPLTINPALTPASIGIATVPRMVQFTPSDEAAPLKLFPNRLNRSQPGKLATASVAALVGIALPVRRALNTTAARERSYVSETIRAPAAPEWRAISPAWASKLPPALPVTRAVMAKSPANDCTNSNQESFVFPTPAPLPIRVTVPADTPTAPLPGTAPKSPADQGVGTAIGPGEPARIVAPTNPSPNAFVPLTR